MRKVLIGPYLLSRQPIANRRVFVPIGTIGTPTPGVDNYFRPGGVDTYHRPDGTSLYKRP